LVGEKLALAAIWREVSHVAPGNRTAHPASPRVAARHRGTRASALDVRQSVARNARPSRRWRTRVRNAGAARAHRQCQSGEQSRERQLLALECSGQLLALWIRLELPRLEERFGS